MENNVLQNNICAIRNRYPKYADLLSDELTNANEVKPFLSDDNGKSFLSVFAHGETYQLQGKYDNSMYVSKRIEWVAKDWELDGKLFMYGFGNGMYAREFLNKVSEDHKIYVYEPSVIIIKFVLQHYDVTDIFSNERFNLYIECDANEEKYSHVVESNMTYTDLFTFKYFNYLNYNFIFPNSISIWTSALEDAYLAINGDRRLYQLHGDMFADNNFSNIKYYIESKDLAKCHNMVPQNVPAIIVASGPSLRKNIKELKKAKGHAIIISLDASVNPLGNEDIIPDIIVAIDPSKGEEYLADPKMRNIPLMCELNSAKGFLSCHKGIKLFSLSYNEYSNAFMEEKNKELVPLPTGGSVATTAFSLAISLGCKTIIFVGQDLAYTGDRTHVDGSIRGNEGIDYIEQNNGNEVIEEDIYGNPIKSNAEYRKFRKWFENSIESHEDIRAIDATEGGAKIGNTEIMSLSQAINETCIEDYNFEKELSKIPCLFNESEKIEYIDYMLSLYDKLEDNRAKIRELYRCYGQMRHLASDYEGNNLKIKKIGQKINQQLDEIQKDYSVRYAKDIGAKELDEILSRIYRTKKNVADELLDICDVGDEYLDALILSIDRLEDVIDKYCEELKSLRKRLV